MHSTDASLMAHRKIRIDTNLIDNGLPSVSRAVKGSKGKHRQKSPSEGNGQAK